MTANCSARDEILRRVRAALGRPDGAPVLHRPTGAASVPRRLAGAEADELALLLAEIARLGGRTRTLSGAAALLAALADLVQTEEIRQAALWQTPELAALQVADCLARLGVIVVPPGAGKEQIAACDLGVTGVDAALPETGTLYLAGGPERGRMVSLLPRVHLALLRPAALRADLHQVLAELEGGRYGVLVSGPSRTSDIELTLTIGVHGPKALYVWLLLDGEEQP